VRFRPLSTESRRHQHRPEIPDVFDASARSLNVLPAIDVQLRPVHIARLLGAQEVDRFGYFLRFTKPVHGNLLINQLADATDQQRHTFETATSWVKARFDPLVARYLPSEDDPLVKTKGPLVPKLDL